MNKKEKNAGLAAGLSILIMAIAAGFSYGYVHTLLVVESTQATARNLIENQSLFLYELIGWVLIFISDLIVAYALLVYFRSTRYSISLLTAATRVVYTLFLGIAIYQLFSLVPIINGTGSADEIISKLNAFENIWSAGLILFGFHLAGLGYLSIKSQFVPGWLGYLLYLGSISYVVVHSAKQLNYFEQAFLITLENALALPMALGELAIAFWFIYKGLKK